MFLVLLPSKNASSRRTAAHHAELIRMKNAPAMVSTKSWDVVCSFPPQHRHQQQLTNALLPVLVWIAKKREFPSLLLPQTLSDFQRNSPHHWRVVAIHIATADFLPDHQGGVHLAHLQECKMQDQIAGTDGRFWVRKCPFLLYPSAFSISGGAVIALCSSKGAGCDVQLRVCLRGTARSQPFSTHFDFCIHKYFPLRLAGL